MRQAVRGEPFAVFCGDSAGSGQAQSYSHKHSSVLIRFAHVKRDLGLIRTDPEEPGKLTNHEKENLQLFICLNLLVYYRSSGCQNEVHKLAKKKEQFPKAKSLPPILF